MAKRKKTVPKTLGHNVRMGRKAEKAYLVSVSISRLSPLVLVKVQGFAGIRADPRRWFLRRGWGSSFSWLNKTVFLFFSPVLCVFRRAVLIVA